MRSIIADAPFAARCRRKSVLVGLRIQDADAANPDIGGDAGANINKGASR